MLLVPMNEILLPTYVGHMAYLSRPCPKPAGVNYKQSWGSWWEWYKNIPKLDCDDDYRTLNLFKSLNKYDSHEY